MIKDIDSKHNFLRQIRKNPKKFEIHDFETDKVVLYPLFFFIWIKIPE